MVIRRRTCSFGVLAILGVGLGVAQGADPSLCIEPQAGCHRPGGIEVRVRMGASEQGIVGGQFVLEYDPSVLQVVDEMPGRACDPASPFEFILLTQDDHASGRLFCAFGVNFLKSSEGTLGPATLGCLSFSPAPGANTATDLCLAEGLHPLSTLLVDNEGHAVPVDTSVDCPEGLSPPSLTCNALTLQEHCTCVPDTLDCHGFDTPCRLGVCNPQTELCEVAFINEGGPCDDGDACTPVDRCNDEGLCIGEGCENSSLCPVSGACLGLDSTLLVRIQLTEGDRVINGGQFSLEYDPLELDLVSISPGSDCDGGSPYSQEVSEMVNEAAGHVFYAVGVELGGPAGTDGPTTLACVEFLDLGDGGGDLCLVEGFNPFSTILTDEFGYAVSPGSITVCPRIDGNPPAACAGFEFCRIPTASAWGLAILTLLLLTTSKVVFAYQRSEIDLACRKSCK